VAVFLSVVALLDDEELIMLLRTMLETNDGRYAL
jgi:hypothetical protein